MRKKAELASAVTETRQRRDRREGRQTVRLGDLILEELSDASVLRVDSTHKLIGQKSNRERVVADRCAWRPIRSLCLENSAPLLVVGNLLQLHCHVRIGQASLTQQKVSAAV